ncbi:MAG: hypothetical protein ACKO91_01555 [Acidimicrobiales bacterium]
MREADTVMLASLHRVREVAGRHLTEGPLPVDVLAAALVADGVELGADPADRVLEALDASTAFVELAGERWCWVPSIADGVTWTTVLDPDDADHDVLPVEDREPCQRLHRRCASRRRATDGVRGATERSAAGLRP